MLVLSNLDPTQKARLTTWLCNQRRGGVEYPKIDPDVLNSVKTFRPLTTTERVERALLYLNHNVRVGQIMRVTLYDPAIHDTTDEFKLMAETESLDVDELMGLLIMIQQMDLLQGMQEGAGENEITPTAKGWLRIDELVSRTPSSSQAFVAMWFSEVTKAAYKEGIEPAIRDCAYRAMRIDKKEHSNKIDDEIIAEIRRSKFLVADFTCEKGRVRGGVYYEAGFAQGIGIPVIWTVSKESLSDLHFDTRQYNHIDWETPQDLRTRLRDRIGALVGDGPIKDASA